MGFYVGTFLYKAIKSDSAISHPSHMSAIVLAEVGDRLVIRDNAAEQPE